MRSYASVRCVARKWSDEKHEKSEVGGLILVAMFVITPGVEARCNWVTDPTNVNFGSYYVYSGTPLDANTTFTLRCQRNDRARVRLTRGTNSLSYTPRTMAGTAGTVAYNLFLDPAATTTIWGDGTSPTSFFDETDRDRNFDVTIYGRIVAGLDVAAGAYSDTITATLTTDNANPDTVTFSVSVTVVAECSITASDLLFGAYDPVVTNASTPRPGSANVTVLCTKGSSINVGLSSGLPANGAKTAFGSRSMKRTTASEWLGYDIFTSSAYSTIWNSTNLLTATASSKNVNMSFTGFGRVPAAQDVTAGNYSDTVTATVNY